jgi:hypothetical protein
LKAKHYASPKKQLLQIIRAIYSHRTVIILGNDGKKVDIEYNMLRAMANKALTSFQCRQQKASKFKYAELMYTYHELGKRRFARNMEHF